MDFRRTAISALILLAPLSSAFAGVSGETTFTTNYIWRGVSQTDNDPALQGDLYYMLGDDLSNARAELNETLNTILSSLYVGLWGSTVNYADDDPAYLELQYYAGAYHEFNKDWSADAYYGRNSYPNARSYNYDEVALAITFRLATVGIEYTNNYFGDGIDNTYVYIALEHELPYEFIIGGHFGHSNKNDEEGTYTDHELYVKRDFLGATWKAAWSDTNGRGYQDDLGNSKITFTVSKLME